eukprot:12905502-Alexandrium_andersonii.AAC.1
MVCSGGSAVLKRLLLAVCQCMSPTLREGTSDQRPSQGMVSPLVPSPSQLCIGDAFVPGRAGRART